MPVLAAVVILIHGLFGNGAEWATMQQALASQGYHVYAPDLPGQDSIANASFIQSYINRVAPNEKVFIVAHSRGGLAARWYQKFLGGAAKVVRLIDIGTPNHGERSVCLFPFPVSQSCPTSPFIFWLNFGVEAPGPTLYTSLWSNYDNAASAPITGGFCNSASLGNVQHLSEPSDPGVIAKVEAALAGLCP